MIDLHKSRAAPKKIRKLEAQQHNNNRICLGPAKAFDKTTMSEQEKEFNWFAME